MLERFTTSARQVVVRAREEAAALGHGHIGTEHLLLAVLADADEPSAAVLVDSGLDHTTARTAALRLLDGGMDGSALAAIGVDLDAVREAVEAVFGQGALDPPAEEPARRRGWFRPGEAGRGGRGGRSPFTARARKTLELSLRESRRLESGRIATGHLVLGLLREGEGLGARVIADHGLDFAAVRRAVEATLG
ncbi:Clp protease N-terminal domain-containing protein [Kitasatospora sp. NPDC088346]|uniref:Clp protease N-terminal domain-containing protein n=1 Tax=Kitasatospora sp. NPDC088346 TaxID=3364073 RepID=UPI00380073AD